MSAPRFMSTPVDPRRLSMLPHQQARQGDARRLHIHGPIEPMLPLHGPREGTRRWEAAIVYLALAVVAAVAWTILLPGAAWLISEIGKGS